MKEEMIRVESQDGIVWRTVNKETVILDQKTGWYYSLDETGTEIWNLFKADKNLQQVTKFIAGKYNVTQKKANSDTLEFIKNLSREKIVKIVTGGAK